MRLARRGEVRRDADMQLLRAAREPGAATARERLGLRHLVEPQQLAVEAPRLRLATRRRGHLDVIQTVDRHAANRDIATARADSATSSKQLHAPSRNSALAVRTAT